jgi:tetratricopeptide (TPR) repeat protein
MRPVPLLTVLLAVAALAGCAGTTTSGPQARVERDRQLVTAGLGRSPYGLFLAGEAALGAGRTQEAAALFARASAGAPENGVIRARAFAAALTAGDIDRAAQLAAQLGPENGPALTLGVLARAVDALAENRAREALALLSTSNTQPPHGLAAEILKPWAAASAGDLAAALAPPAAPAAPPLVVAPRAEASAPRAASVGQLAETLNQGGRLILLERAGRFEEADALVTALALEEVPLRQSLRAGAYLERRRRAPEAVALYERLTARAPNDRSLRAALARARAGRTPPPPPSIRTGAGEAMLIPAAAFGGGRQFETAMAYARLALHLDPRLDDAQMLVGDLAAASGDVEGARRAYLALQPDSDLYPGARARLALLLNDNGRKAEGLALIREAAAASPEDGSVLTAYSALLAENGREAEAADVFDQALASARGRGDWRLWWLRGSARERAGRWPEAERDLQEALRLAPEEPDVLNSLGYSWIDRGQRLQEALAMVQKAAALRPRSGAIVDSLGWAYYRLGQYAPAVEALERAAELEPGDPTINDHLGDAYWRVGRRTEAQFQWTRALSLEPEPKLKADVQAKLASPAGPDVARSSAQAAQP